MASTQGTRITYNQLKRSETNNTSKNPEMSEGRKPEKEFRSVACWPLRQPGG